MPSTDALDAGAAGLTLGTAGHIDHGKTTLVSALTGTDTDRLAEEKRRGISIELGFAELDLGGGRSLGIVDAPGHERLVRTMVAGASGIDMFLLVVAADDGIMPQTREHLTVLGALGVERGIVAISKIDTVSAELAELASIEAMELVGDARAVEVSARTGEGLAELREAITELAGSLEAQTRGPEWLPQAGLMHVDRAFTITGSGTVVTGTAAAGTFSTGQSVSILPSGESARIRGLQRHGRDLARIGRGRRTAINLVGVSLDHVGRGDVIAVDPETEGVAVSYRLDCQLNGDLAGASLDGLRIQAHHGTRSTPARVVDLGHDLIQLRLSEPLIAVAGDRVVLRRIAPPGTLGGAEVVDPDPVRHGAGPETERLLELIEGEPEAILGGALKRRTETLPEDPALWRAEPQLAYGLRRFGRDRWLQAIAALAAEGHASREFGVLRSGGEQAAGGSERQRAPLSSTALRLAEVLTTDGLEPRAPTALAEEVEISRSEALEGLAELVADGKAIRIKEDIYYDAGRLSQITHLVSAIAHREGSITLAELRDALHTSRKYSQAILEYLDGRGILVRQGDRHLPRGGAVGDP